jgi:putative ABC transport system ATP-binding protein
LKKYPNAIRRSEDMKNIIETKKLCKTFSNGGIQQHVLKNIDLEIYEGDFTIIMGASGAGKSTLLYSLSGMDKPTLGSVKFDGTEITKMNTDELAIFRRSHCGFVFQQVYLVDSMSVLDNIMAAGLLVYKDKNTLADKAGELLKAVSIEETLWNKFPTQISGGEAQRVGIVRAIINDPKILFADEPTGQLNSASSRDVLDIFKDIHKNGQSIVMVTHDLKTALRGTRVLYLRDGGVVGDYRMPNFREDDIKERRNNLTSFLEDMGW